MHIDQRLGDLAQHFLADSHAVDARRRPSAAAQFARDDDEGRVFLLQQIGALQRGHDHGSRMGIEREHAFDHGLVCSGANEGVIGLAAQKLLDGVNDDRLAGPGFTRDDIEPRREAQFQVVDDCEIADPQFFQHTPS
mgnify:CR=1 FL=1